MNILFFGELMAGSKILRGSLLIMISMLFFRVGGFIYKFIIARMLGPSGYGIFGLTLPFIGVFQILSAAGFPPAIAKFVAQHKAVGEYDKARQVIITSTKLMMFLGVSFGLLMFFSANWIAITIFSKPEMTIPLQAVSLIMPFSVIVGAFRGAFQGIYKMELIVVSRAVEQLFTILLGIALVAIGFYAVGAILGTGLGFLASAVVSYILFRKYVWTMFAKPEVNISLREELRLLKTLLAFSIPVTITALSEMAIYDVSTLVIGYYLALKFVGYYTAADPFARIPLIISLSVATVILPAASEAASLKNKALLDKYVTESYRYVILTVFPLCVGIALFAGPIISILGSNYLPGAPVLSILVIGMTFYSLFMVSASITQGVGHPRVPMYTLLLGTVINIALNFLMIPLYGIIGAAIATTLAAFIIMAIVLWQTFKITKVKLPYKEFVKIAVASIIMGLPLLLLPQTFLGLVAAVIISPIIFLFAFMFIGGFNKKDVILLRRYTKKLGPLSGASEKLIIFIERFAK